MILNNGKITELLSVLNKPINQVEWLSLVSKCEISPLIEMFPGGYGVASFHGEGIQVSFVNYLCYSVGLYGSAIEYVRGLGMFSGLLPHGLKFGLSADDVTSRLGVPVHHRFECPPESKDPCIEALFYRLDDFGVIARFDSRSRNALTYVELLPLANLERAVK